MGAEETRIEYGIRPCAPPVPLSEVEIEGDAFEVIVMWGRNVLHVDHVSADGRYVLGEGPEANLLIGTEVLGAGQWVLLDEGSLGLAPAVSGTFQRAEGATQAVAGPLAEGTEARLRAGDFTVVVRRVKPGRRIAGGVRTERAPLMYVGGSMLIAAGMLALFSLMPPSASAISIDDLNRQSRLAEIFLEPPETEEEEAPEEVSVQAGPSGGEGERHDGDEGAMGDLDAPQTGRRYGVAGPENNPDPHLSDRASREEFASTAGILGALPSFRESWNAPSSPYGRETALGRDPMDALGALMGDTIGASGGSSGLGLYSTGRGAGGDGRGTIGLDGLGETLGHGGGCRGERCGSGYGRSHGLGNRGRQARVPHIRSTGAEVHGGLSRDVIQRVIRRHHPEVRHCYQQALQARPDLEGRVTTRFVISSTGVVSASLVAGSTLGHAQTESCISQAVRRWTFPAPEGGGVVSVTYPFVLATP